MILAELSVQKQDTWAGDAITPQFSIALNLTSRETATVPVAIARFAQQYEVLHGQMAVASMVSTIPALLLMFFGQRFVVQGLTMGAVK